MSLDISLTKSMPTEVYEGNITHNLNKMAEAVGIYKALWRPEEIGITEAGQLIPILENGLHALTRTGPGEFRQYEPENKWGTWETLVAFTEKYLAACREHPDAKVSACR